MKQFFHSIPAKICLLVLGGEVVVLTLLGVVFVGRIHYEVDAGIARKMTTPVHLYEQGLLPEAGLLDRTLIGRLLQEEVLLVRLVDGLAGTEAFVDESYRSFLQNGSEIRLGEFRRDGAYQMEGLVPIAAGGDRFDRLYIRISADNHVVGKHDIFLYYCLAAAGVILFSAVLASLITFRLFIPRIRHIGGMLKRVEQGDFSARVQESGDDELGRCMVQVNSLVATIEDYIEKLNELNRTAEALAHAFNRDEVVRVVAEVIEKQFNARCVAIRERASFKNEAGGSDRVTGVLIAETRDAVLAGETLLVRGAVATAPGATWPSAPAVLLVPIIEDGGVTDVMVFHGSDRTHDMGPVAREFARSLARMVNTTFNRIRSLHEITQAESKYRALFMTALDGIFRVNTAGRFEDINPALAAMCGYDSVEQMHALALDTTNLYADPDEAADIEAALERHGRVTDIGIQLRRKDGSTFPASISAHAVLGKDGRSVAYEGNLVDMSERTLREEAERERAVADAAHRAKSEMVADLEKKNDQLEKTLEEVRIMQRQLLQSEKMAGIGALASGVAHDLNNILAGAVSYPDLLLTQLPDNHGMRKPLIDIREAGIRAVDMVNDLLTLSQGAAKVWESAELNGIIEKCLQTPEITQLQLLNPGLQLEAVLCPDPTFIRCAPLHLKKAVVGLIKNGIEAAGEHGRVEITTAVQEVGRAEFDSLALQAGSHVVLTIADNGPGIAEKHHERMFEPFYFRKVTGIGAGGTGLGLAVVWNVVQEHEGAVVVTSPEDSGTVFRIFLPVADPDSDRGEGAEPFTVDLRGSGTVLVVDDEPLQRDIAGKMLAELGYQAYIVASGQAALEFIEKRPVDLVLLDLLMPPGLNGRETYEKMVRIRPEQKALLMSGYFHNVDMPETPERGPGGVLKKPYSLAQLGRAVQTVLKHG